MLNLSKSVYYYQSQKNDEPVEAALRHKAEEQPREGFWKAFGHLRNEGPSEVRANRGVKVRT